MGRAIANGGLDGHGLILIRKYGRTVELLHAGKA